MSHAKVEQGQKQVVKEMIQIFGAYHDKAAKSSEFLAHIRSFEKFHRTISWAISRAFAIWSFRTKLQLERNLGRPR